MSGFGSKELRLKSGYFRLSGLIRTSSCSETTSTRGTRKRSQKLKHGPTTQSPSHPTSSARIFPHGFHPALLLSIRALKTSTASFTRSRLCLSSKVTRQTECPQKSIKETCAKA